MLALLRFETARRELRHAWRAIRRMPVLASVVVLSLGVGIGVNTAIFSWLQAVFFQPLPGVHDAASFQFVEPRGNDVSESYPGVSWQEYGDLRERLHRVRELIAFRMTPFNIGDPGRSERTYGMLVSPGYFRALGLVPARGRFLTDDEVAHPGGAPVVVVSYGFWQNHLAGAANVVGRTLRVNERLLTIVGVAPERFQGTVLMLDFDLWVPATLAPVLLGGSTELDDRSVRGYSAMGRLRPGVSHDQAQAEVDDAMRQLARAYPKTNASMVADVLPFWRAPRGPQRFLAQALVILQGFMLLLLLAVCANTANLVLARASARHREIGVRRALGASAARIVVLLLTESVLMSTLGALLGVAIAVWGSQALRAVPMIATFPIRFQTGVDGGGLAFAIALGIGCGLLFGAAPAIQLARIDPQTALRSGARTTTRDGLRNAIMATEVALALVVLLVAGIFLQRFGESRVTDPGFRSAGVLLAAYDLTGRDVNDDAARTLAATMLARLRAQPGVEAASIALSVPLDIHGMPLRAFTVEGRARTSADDEHALMNVVTPDYFRAMGIPFRAGHDFADLRDGAAPLQAIVNEAFVQHYLDGAEALGRWIENGGRRFVITGVVRTSVNDAFGEPPTPVIYYAFRDRSRAYGTIHLRTRAGAETAVAQDVRRIVRDIDPLLPLYDVRTLNEHIERSLVFRRIPARMFAVLGPLLLALAAIGIYAVVAYGVARRTRELGVRIALGATARQLVMQIVRETLRVVGSGAMIGWLLAAIVELHIAQGRPMELTVFIGVPALLMLVAAVASWVPAWRASRRDPHLALRQD